MVTVDLLVWIEAKPDKVDEVEAMLTAAVEKVEKEEGTTIWLALPSRASGTASVRPQRGAPRTLLSVSSPQQRAHQAATQLPWNPCGTRCGSRTRATGSPSKSEASTITRSLPSRAES
jgi:hypothetical protein